mgnify:CR=1 FL=1
MRKIKICITCVNGFLTYDFIESFKNQTDFKPFIIGLDILDRSKGKILCDKFYKISNPKNEKKYLNDIIKVYKKEKFDIIIPLSDLENYLLLKNKNKLQKLKINFNLPTNDFATAKLFYDKEKFLNFCKQNDFPTGNFKIVKRFQEVINFIGNKKSKKFILKPVKGSGTKNVFLINNQAKKSIQILESRNCIETNLKLLKNLKIFNRNSDYIIMDYLEGEIYDIDCIAKNGKIEEFCIRLREIRNRFMFYSTGHRIVKDTKIKNLISNFVRKLNISGVCDFDVIKNKNKVFLLEASCRFSGSVGACTKSGLNFPAQIIRHIMNMKKKKYNLEFNNSFRSFLVFKKIKSSKRNILLDDYIPHYAKQLKY